MPGIVCRSDLSVMWLCYGQVLPVSGAEKVLFEPNKLKQQWGKEILWENVLKSK